MANSKRKHPPIPVIVIVVLVLIGGGVWWWWSSTQAASSNTNQFSGSVEATSSQIGSALAGRISSVPVAEGDHVAKGDLLVQLDQTAMKLQVDQAEQGVAAAKAALSNARDTGTSADVKAAKARLAQARAAVKLAKLQLSYTSVTAPNAGVVTAVNANPGQNAAPSKTLVTLLDPNDLFVRIYVPETVIGNIKIGQQATVTTDSVTTAIPAEVSFVAAEAEFTPNTVQTKDQRTKLVYEVRVRVADESGTLKAGMPVDVTLD
ncbi:MAG TPA: efflux RND transporter periplasmic adaptor subunit [Propionicimonas sp.]|nr:efflux RND transporter periplasmic adaptor subunit [Propionicimonas sp.]